MKNIFLIGSTGSIGRTTIDTVECLNKTEEGKNLNINITALCAKKNWNILKEQIQKIKPRYSFLIDENTYEKIPASEKNEFKIQCDKDKILKLIESNEIDIVFLAVSGSDGLDYAFHTLKNKKKLLLANKECIVMAGELLMNIARNNDIPIIPVDSEHSAIFQILKFNPSKIKKVILTASGGPFLCLDRSQFSKIKPEDALKHPVWNMGEKNTIDSATLVNKALEIIEAMWLFNLNPEQIEVVIHPQCIIHAFVEFEDGNIIAILSEPDMKLPIQYALTYPHRIKTPTKFCLDEISKLEFQKVDLEKFPSIKIGYDAARKKGFYGTVFNSANEVAVNLFLSNKIRFDEIFTLLEDILSEYNDMIDKPKEMNLQNIKIIHNWARERALLWKKF